MKTPDLGSVVLYAPLSDEPSQSFVAAAGNPVGEAVIQPAPSAGGFRAATVIGASGDDEAGHVALLVYKQPGDPYRDGADALMQRLGDVPYSEHGAPGTWTYPDQVDDVPQTA